MPNNNERQVLDELSQVMHEATRTVAREPGGMAQLAALGRASVTDKVKRMFGVNEGEAGEIIDFVTDYMVRYAAEHALPLVVVAAHLGGNRFWALAGIKYGLIQAGKQRG